MKNTVVRALLISCVAQLILSVTAQAGQLTYRGINLQSLGIYKSSALPSDPGTSLYGLTFVTGFSDIPSGIPGNTLELFPIAGTNWSSGTYDSDGNKVQGVGKITATAEILRFLYVYPDALQPANTHIRLASDFVLPALVNVHVNIGGNSGSGLGGGNIGDISWAPIAVLFTGYGNSNVHFSTYLGALFNLPTGSYSENSAFNIGSNEYSMTVLANPIVTFPNFDHLFLDTEFQYTHTIRGNNRFRIGGNEAATLKLVGAPSSTYSTGDLFTINADVLVPVTPRLALGPSFAVLDQLTNDTWSGSTVSNSGEFLLGAGFGLQYRFNGINFQVKYLRSFHARNTPRYNTVWAQFSVPFGL